uniref:Flocculation protein FLO11-like n=1 Tax=Nicotiana sylvestris TaxID=4096 RepID=A0A1U7Y213_NICSY
MMIPAPNQRISSFRIGFSFVYTYPFTLGFNPAIDPVILEFCRFFKICLAQVGPLVWRAVACLRYLSTKANVNFTFSHLVHLYHPKLFRHGVFTLTARSKKVLVNPEDDKDRGWYCRYVAVRTVDLLGETNIPFPEKWNFAPTMGDVEHVPNFRGFGIRGMTAEVVVAIQASSTASLDLEKTRATLPKRKVVEESSENEEEENTSLIARPRARRCVIDGDEVEDTPARASISEPIQILSDEDTTPRGSNELIRLLDETPFSSSIPISSIPSIPLTTTSISLPILSTPVSLPVLVPISAPTVPALTPTAPIVFTSSTTPHSIVPPPSVQHTEAGSSSRANLIGTESMGRISTLEKKDRESAKAISEARRISKETQLEAANWKEHQFEKDKELLECSFLEQLSKASQHREELLNEEAATTAIGVAIPTPEGETSMTQSMEAEASVTLASLGDFNTPGPVETAHIVVSSKVVTVPVTAPENEIATSD